MSSNGLQISQSALSGKSDALLLISTTSGSISSSSNAYNDYISNEANSLEEKTHKVSSINVGSKD